MKALVVALGLAIAAPAAHAAGAITTESRPDAFVIHVDGVAVGGQVDAAADHIDVPLVAGAHSASHVRLPDALVRKVELGGAHTPRVRIKLRGDAAHTRAIASVVQVHAIDHGLEIVVPREPAAVTVPAPAPPPAPGPEAAAPAPAPAPAPEPAPAPAPLPVVTPVAAAAPIAGAPSSSMPWTSLLLVGGVIAGAALIVRSRRKTGGRSPHKAIELRTSMSLGGKSRVVLIAAHDREILVAVDPRGVRLLDAWNRDELRLPDDDAAIPPARLPSATAKPSPSVSGLMKLRGEPHAASAAIEDESWAEDLMASLRKKGSPS